MNARSLSTQLAKSVRNVAFINAIIARKGLLAVDPETDAGREILVLAWDFEAAASPDRPYGVRMQGVQMAVESVILRRLHFTQILEFGGVFSTGHTRKAAAERAAHKQALEGYHRAARTLEVACRMMGVEGYADMLDRANDQDELRRHLQSLNERSREARTIPAEASAAGDVSAG